MWLDVYFPFSLTSECEGICSAVCRNRRYPLNTWNKMIWVTSMHSQRTNKMIWVTSMHSHGTFLWRTAIQEFVVNLDRLALDPLSVFLGYLRGHAVQRAIRIFDNLSLLQLHQLIGSLVEPLVWLICHLKRQRRAGGRSHLAPLSRYKGAGGSPSFIPFHSSQDREQLYCG